MKADFQQGREQCLHITKLEINIVQWNEEKNNKSIYMYLQILQIFHNITNIVMQWILQRNEYVYKIRMNITKWNNVLIIHIKASDGTVVITEWFS